MSASTDTHQQESLNLEQLSGAVLKYENADGETVCVEFEE